MRRLGRMSREPVAMAAWQAAPVAGLLGFALAVPATAATEGAGESSGALEWTVTADGTDVDSFGPGKPLVLERDDTLVLDLEVNNLSDFVVELDDVRLRGRVMGVSFFDLGAGLDVVLDPGEEAVRRVELRTHELARQAVGAMPGDLQLVDTNRDVVVTKEFPTEVRGSLFSAYGVFGLAVLAFTILLLMGLLWAMWRDRLPANRWVRGLRFAVPALGVGMTLTFFLSVSRLLTPDADVWLPLVVGCGAGGFILGYLLPSAWRPDRTRPAADAGASPQVAIMPAQRRRQVVKVLSAWRRP